MAEANATQTGGGLRHATPHYANGVAAHVNVDAAPLVLSRPTGWRTSEIALVVAQDGSLVLQPAFGVSGAPIGLIRSVDQGQTWAFIEPSDRDNPPREIGLDQDMRMDRTTGRIFWATPGYKGMAPVMPDAVSRLDISDDGGRTWFRSSAPPLGEPDPATGQASRDHPQIFSGPPPAAMRARMGDYPNIVYVCQSNAPQLVARSLDGGVTFEAPVPLPFPPTVPAPLHRLPDDVEGVMLNTNFGLRGVVDDEGTIYLPNTPANKPYVAISRDGGDNWDLVLITEIVTHGFGMLSLGLDAGNNLYAGWVDASNRLPYLSVSRDRGRHWSVPMMVGAPGITEAALPCLVAGAQGHVAFTYYGSENSPGRPFPPPPDHMVAGGTPAWAEVTWNTYITESYDALAQRPVFWSAPLNDPTCPTWYGASPSAAGVITMPAKGQSVPPGASHMGSQPASMAFWQPPSFGGHIDYYGLDMAPNGATWVGYNQACPNGLPVSGNPNTATAAGAPTDVLFAMVGCLIRPAGLPTGTGRA